MLQGHELSAVYSSRIRALAAPHARCAGLSVQKTVSGHQRRDNEVRVRSTAALGELVVYISFLAKFLALHSSPALDISQEIVPVVLIYGRLKYMKWEVSE